MYGVVLILVLAVVGGAIAFIGDRLGSRIGKKKLSLFGKRPKDTATIVTVVTGVLITVAAFAIMSIASENVRIALFGMEKINRQMQETQEKLTAASTDLTATRDALKNSQAEVNKLEDRQKELTDKTARIEAGNRELEAEKNNLLASNDQLSAQNREMAGTNAQLAAERTQLIKETDELKEGLIAVREGDISFRAREVVAAGVIKAQRSADEVRKDIGALIAQADMKVVQRTGVTDDRARVWLRDQNYREVVDAIVSGKKDSVVRLVVIGNIIVGEPVRCEIETYENRRVYQADELILTRRLNISNINPQQAQELVMAFLQEVNETARQRGMIPDSLTGAVGALSAEQFYEMADAVSKTSGPVAFMAYAAGDTDRLGPLRLKLAMAQEAGSN